MLSAVSKKDKRRTRYTRWEMSDSNRFSSRVDGKEKSVITGGVYPFSLTLPEKLPCSFEGRYGRVRYSIRALLDVTTIYRFSTNIIPFTVAPILDLNRDPLAPVSRNLTTSDITLEMWFHFVGSNAPFELNARSLRFLNSLFLNSSVFRFVGTFLRSLIEKKYNNNSMIIVGIEMRKDRTAIDV